MLMTYNTTVRASIIVMALFPTLWGILALLNNSSGFAKTAQYAVAPMLAMTDTYGNPAQTWRAIHSPFAGEIGLILITLFETLAGLFGLWSIVKMIKTINAPFQDFQQDHTSGPACARRGLGRRPGKHRAARGGGR